MGLEVHAQILSKSKLFSGASAVFRGGMPNSQVSLFDAALPGTLPALNAHCVKQAIRAGAAMGGTVCRRSIFERKHYFYCDMPLGYQITQQRAPIVRGGQITVRVPLPTASKEFYQRSVNINRIQLEIDSGKSLHDFSAENSMVDLNR